MIACPYCGAPMVRFSAATRLRSMWFCEAPMLREWVDLSTKQSGVTTARCGTTVGINAA